MSVLRHGFADGTPKHNSCTRDEWRSLLALQSCRSRTLLAQAWARQLSGNSLRRSKTVACTLCPGMLLLLHVVARLPLPLRPLLHVVARLLHVVTRLSPSLRLPLFLRTLPPLAGFPPPRFMPQAPPGFVPNPFANVNPFQGLAAEPFARLAAAMVYNANVTACHSHAL